MSTLMVGGMACASFFAMAATCFDTSSVAGACRLQDDVGFGARVE